MKRNSTLDCGYVYPQGVKLDWEKKEANSNSHLTPAVQIELVPKVCITFTVILKAEKAWKN